MPNFLVQSYLVETKWEQAAYSKGPQVFPLHCTLKSSNRPSCHIGPEMEAIKHMLGYASEEGQEDGQIPKGGPSLVYLFLPQEAEQQAAWRFLTLPLLNMTQLISWNLTNLMNKSSHRGQRPGEMGREMELPFLLNTCSSKYGPQTDHQYYHHLVAC